MVEFRRHVCTLVIATALIGIAPRCVALGDSKVDIPVQIKMNIFTRDLDKDSPNTFDLVCEINNTAKRPVLIHPQARVRFERPSDKSIPHLGIKQKTAEVTADSEEVATELTIIVRSSDESFPLMEHIVSIRGSHDADPIIVAPGATMFLRLSIQPQLKTSLRNAEVSATVMKGNAEVSKSNKLTLR